MLNEEHFVWQKFFLFISEHLKDEFWEIPDEIYPHNSLFPKIIRERFKRYLREVYDARSKYMYGGTKFPLYVDLGTRREHPANVTFELMKLAGKSQYLPPFAWFERLTHLVAVEYMLRSFAPDLVTARASDLAQKQRLLDLMATLAPNVQTSLRKLTHWMTQFLGYAVINPHCPNKDWADSVETVAALVDAGIIKTDQAGLEGSSCLRNREVAEAVGEFVYGAEANRFRGNELFLLRAAESIFEDARSDAAAQEPPGSASE